VRDAARAVDWYTNVFGAEERLRIPVSDGRLMSVDLRFGDSRVMLTDEFLEMGVLSPQTLGGTYMARLVEPGRRAGRSIATSATTPPANPKPGNPPTGPKMLHPRRSTTLAAAKPTAHFTRDRQQPRPFSRGH
jgi:catechol 2,3-dioxygenase-like lactoylglutathione lyase family enzyme